MSEGPSNTGGGQSNIEFRSPAGRFVATSWTAVMAAGQPETPQAQEALARLCEAYWQPLHDYVRRLGHSETDAKDLTQEFFLRILSKNLIAAADRDRGKFRTFLLTALNHFLTNEWHRNQAAKRGGGQAMVSIDAEPESDAPHHEPATDASPEILYQRSWAASVFRLAQDRLGEEYVSAGKTKLFEHLKIFLDGSPDPRGYHPVAAQLNMTPNAVGVVVHRMRQRLGQLIRGEVERTLVNPTEADIDAEMRFLLETAGR